MSRARDLEFLMMSLHRCLPSWYLSNPLLARYLIPKPTTSPRTVYETPSALSRTHASSTGKELTGIAFGTLRLYLVFFRNHHNHGSKQRVHKDRWPAVTPA